MVEFEFSLETEQGDSEFSTASEDINVNFLKLYALLRAITHLY